MIDRLSRANGAGLPKPVLFNSCSHTPAHAYFVLAKDQSHMTPEHASGEAWARIRENVASRPNGTEVGLSLYHFDKITIAVLTEGFKNPYDADRFIGRISRAAATLVAGND